jgi:DNA-binding HxlR family transcriptional regulator
VIAASPPFAEYRLTAQGRELAPLVEALERWTATRA